MSGENDIPEEFQEALPADVLEQYERPSKEGDSGEDIDLFVGTFIFVGIWWTLGLLFAGGTLGVLLAAVVSAIFVVGLFTVANRLEDRIKR